MEAGGEAKAATAGPEITAFPFRVLKALSTILSFQRMKGKPVAATRLLLLSGKKPINKELLFQVLLHREVGPQALFLPLKVKSFKQRK